MTIFANSIKDKTDEKKVSMTSRRKTVIKFIKKAIQIEKCPKTYKNQNWTPILGNLGEILRTIYRKMDDFENLTKGFEPGIKKCEFLFFSENNFN